MCVCACAYVAIHCELHCVVCVCAVRGGERCELLQLASLLAVQFGVEHPELLVAMKAPLLQLGQDPTAGVAERAVVSGRGFGPSGCVCD